MSKPKIFGYCHAGCSWETIHREEFEQSAAFVFVSVDKPIMQGHIYHIAKPIGEVTMAFRVLAKLRKQYLSQAEVEEKFITISVIGLRKYDDYVSFRWNEFYKDADEATGKHYLSIEVNNVPYTYEVFVNIPERDLYTIYLDDLVFDEGVTGVRLVNENARLTAERVFVRYSANSDGSDFTEEWTEGQKYIGIATGREAPTDKSGYVWSRYVVSEGTVSFEDLTDAQRESLKGDAYILTEADKAEIAQEVIAQIPVYDGTVTYS